MEQFGKGTQSNTVSFSFIQHLIHFFTLATPHHTILFFHIRQLFNFHEEKVVIVARKEHYGQKVVDNLLDLVLSNITVNSENRYALFLQKGFYEEKKKKKSLLKTLESVDNENLHCFLVF